MGHSWIVKLQEMKAFYDSESYRPEPSNEYGNGTGEDNEEEGDYFWSKDILALTKDDSGVSSASEELRDDTSVEISLANDDSE